MTDHTEGGNTGRIGLLGMLTVAPVVFAALLSLTMRAGLILGRSVEESVALSVIAAIALASGSFGRNGLRDLLPVKPTPVEFGTVAALLAMLVTLWDRAANRSLLWPHLFGVDPAHHAAIVRWISEMDRLPEINERLVGLGNYPVGAHLIAAAATSLSGRTPIAGMWWTAIGAGVSQLFAIAWLTRTCSVGRSWTGVGVAIILWLGAWQFGIGGITISFFFAQVVAVSFSLVGVGLIALGANGLAARRWLPATLILLVATAFTYPQGAVVIPAALGLFTLAAMSDFIRNATVGRRRGVVAILITTMTAVGVVATRGVDSPYLTKQAFYGQGEGALPPLNIVALGGLLAATLFAAGTVDCVVRAWRGDRRALVLGGALAGPAAVLVALLVLREIGEPVTTYRINKNFYAILPLLAVAVGAATGSLLARFESQRGMKGVTGGSGSKRNMLSRSGWMAIAGLVLALGVTLRPSPLRLASEPIVNPDAYILGSYAARTFDPRDVGVAGEGVSPYVLWFVLFRENALRPNDPVAPRLTVWDDWPNGARDERFLLVDASVAPQFTAKAGVKVVARRGGALLLERT